MTKLAILLASYNGSKYIREQLDSLFSQTCLDWTLYVQDDISTDNTMDILREYQKAHDNMVILDNNKKLGSMMNFTSMLSSVDASYYMFCDQDDVWLPSKVERTLSKMEELERQNEGRAVAVHTDLRVVDKDLKLIAPSFWDYSRISPDILRNLDYMGAHCLATGCTMMINDKAKHLCLPMPEVAIMHDAWIILKLFQNKEVVGEVCEPLILYRQHGHNTLGAQDMQNNYISKRLAALPSVIAMNRRYYAMLKEVDYGSVFKYIYYKVKYYFIYTVGKK